ncbi:MAG: hypothetical protein JXA79_12745, partial [Deltaproteobacteria bacterium]|nr:hypothetical protein [Deltaproteobacteria bacterium]
YWHTEQLMLHQETPDHIEVMQKFAKDSVMGAIKNHWPIHSGTGDIKVDLYGPHCSNYDKWMRKIKKTLDPNLVSESSSYVTLKE